MRKWVLGLAVTGFVESDPGAPLDIRISEVKSPHSPKLFYRFCPTEAL